MATCEGVGSELRWVVLVFMPLFQGCVVVMTFFAKMACNIWCVCRFGAVWFESSLCATHFERIDMRLNASLMHERRVAVAIAGWMQLLLHLNTAALKTCATVAQATARLALLRKGFPYALWDMDR